MPISITRKIIDAILDGSLAKCETAKHIRTGFSVPMTAKIPPEILMPESGWGSIADYASAADELMNLFKRARNEIIN